MKEEINKNELDKFNRDGVIFTALLLISVLSVVPLVAFFSYYGLLISAVIYGISMYYALRIEKYKKTNDIQTYKEIVFFTEGKRLDEVEKARESGKRPYQKILLVCFSALITLVVTLLFDWLLKRFIL